MGVGLFEAPCRVPVARLRLRGRVRSGRFSGKSPLGRTLKDDGERELAEKGACLDRGSK